MFIVGEKIGLDILLTSIGIQNIVATPAFRNVSGKNFFLDEQVEIFRKEGGTIHMVTVMAMMTIKLSKVHRHG